MVMRIPLNAWAGYEGALEDKPIFTKTMVNVVIYLLVNPTRAVAHYKAFPFDPLTRIPVADKSKCTGCGLCESICPALACISVYPRDKFPGSQAQREGSVRMVVLMPETNYVLV
eukprot:scaffold8048_cov155-Amphora_coffeaeformis.AAC.3